MSNPQIGTHEYFERLYEVEEGHWWSRGMREIAAGILRSRVEAAGASVLDAGCGTGINLGWLRQFRPRRVVGVDLSRDALEFCRRRGEARLAQASVLALPFAGESFELVVCNDVIQHLPGRGGDLAALKEFRRVLRPGGHLLVRTNASWGLGEAGDEDYRRYRLDELCALVRGAGFEVSRATYANALPALLGRARRLRPEPASQAGPHRHNPGLGIRLFPAHLRWLNTALHWLMKGEARLLARPAATLSFGHTIFFLARRLEDE